MPHRISSVVFEAILFGLTVYKFYGAANEGWGQRSLLNLLVRDSIWAFALVFSEWYLALSTVYSAQYILHVAAMVANTLLFTLAPATLAALGFPYVHRVRPKIVTDRFSSSWLLAILGALVCAHPPAEFG